MVFKGSITSIFSVSTLLFVWKVSEGQGSDMGVGVKSSISSLGVDSVPCNCLDGCGLLVSIS